MTDKRNLGRNAKKNSQLGWNCFKKILIMFFITICLLKVKKMTRLSHIPFAKSFLALSLSAVFSGAVYAGAEDIPTNEDFVVTVNGIEQQEAHSGKTNPSGRDYMDWWGSLTLSKNNIVQLNVKNLDNEGITEVWSDVFGGWSSSGDVRNNQVTITGSKNKNLFLEGAVYGGYFDGDNNSIVERNRVSVSNAIFGDDNGDTEDTSFVVGGASFNNSQIGFDSDNSSDFVRNNSVHLTKVEIGDNFLYVRGGMVLQYMGDTACVENNSVVIANAKNFEESSFAGLDIVGGSVNRAVHAYALGNHVELNQISENIYVNVIGGSSRGLETYANNNIVKIYDSSAVSVIAARARSTAVGTNLSVGLAQANENQLIWHNRDGINVELQELIVAFARSSDEVNVSNNYGEIVGLKTGMILSNLSMDSRESLSQAQVVGFEADGEETGLVSNTNNVLTIHQSRLPSVSGAVASGDQVLLFGNRVEITGTEDDVTEVVGDLVAFDVTSNTTSVFDNSFKAKHLVTRNVQAIRVGSIGSIGSNEADIRENVILIDDSNIEVFNGIAIDNSQTANVSANHIALSGVSFENSSVASEGRIGIAKTPELITINASRAVAVTDNILEVQNGQGVNNILGIEVLSIENGSKIDVKNNTLLIKDTDVEEAILGILIGGDLTDTQLNLQNNTLILDNVLASSVAATVIDGPGGFRGASFADHEQGRIVLRGHNRVNQTFAGFDSLQFDLNTAEAGKAMLELRESLALDGQTLVINTAGLSSVSEDLNLIESTGGAVTMNNVTLQTAGTFETKSMVVSNNEGLDSFSLGLYYDELMAQESVLSDSTLTLSDSQLATIALTRQSSEEALSLLQSSDNLSVDAPVKGFATLSGSSNFYELGTGFDLNGTSLTVGGALRINDNWSGVAFAQYSDANADSTVSGFRGDSDMKTYSAGVALRYQTEMPFYTEGAVVFGQADTDFVGSYTNDTACYNSDRFYTTAQLGIGSDVKLSDAVNLNVYGRYSFTYLDGDKVALNNATRDTFDIDDTMVHAMRVGARVKGSVAPNVQWFAGAAFERVLDGDVESMVNDAKLKTETLKGNVGIFEVGATLAPNDLGPWTMDVKAGAYAGDRRGVSGSVSVNYVF